MTRKGVSGLLAMLLLVLSVAACGNDEATKAPASPAASPAASAEA